MSLDLQAKAGPLPIYGWVLAVGGGLAIAYWRRSHTTTKQAVAAAQADPGTLDNTVSTAGNLGSQASSNPSSDPYAGIDTGNAPTNDSWSRVAQQRLIASGVSPTAAAGAINGYLNGDALTTGQQALVDAGIIAAGVPPEYVAPPLPGSGTPTVTTPADGGAQAAAAALAAAQAQAEQTAAAQEAVAAQQAVVAQAQQAAADQNASALAAAQRAKAAALEQTKAQENARAHAPAKPPPKPVKHK